MTADRLLFTRRQVAIRLGVRRADVSTWVKDGRLRTVEIDGRERIPFSEIERVLRDGIPRKDEPVKRNRASEATKSPGTGIRRIKL